MKGTLTIFKKELKGFYLNPTFWTLCFLLCLFFSYNFSLSLKLFAQLLSNYVMQQGVSANQLNIHFGLFIQQLSYLHLLMIIVIPALTMKLFAEEKKMRTFDLLLTSPVTSLQIVLGKYFASLGALFGIVMLALAYPIATATLTKFQWGPLLVAFFGIFMLGAVYTAIDLFCSSLTENILISYVAAVIMNFLVLFIGGGVELADSEMGRKIFEHISVITHMMGMIQGIVRTSGLVFFLSLIVLFCFLAERVVESTRWR